MKSVTYYIGFYKYDDSSIWQKTNLNKDKKELGDYLENLQYVDKSSIVIKEIDLPN